MDAGSHLLASHYDILGAPMNAEYAEIRSKYRAAILALHPDKLSGSEGSILNSASTDSLRILLSHLNDNDNNIASNEPKSTIKDLDMDDSQFNRSTISNADEFGFGAGDVRLSQFMRVQNAWEVLRDAESRAKYDKFLRAERLAHEMKSTRIAGDEIHLEEMDLCSVSLDSGEEVEYSYPCRCGDLIVVSQEELRMAGVEFDDETPQQAGTRGIRASSGFHRPRSNSLLLPCQSCSLHICLLLPPP